MKHFIKDEAGYFIGTEFTDPEDMVANKTGFCGCGNPVAAYKFMLLGMQCVVYLNKFCNHEITWEQWKDVETKVFGSEGAAYFFYYYLAKENLTSHGGSVPGWLNEKGIELLELLTEWSEYKKVNPEL